jgi:hypothetical protein
MPWGDGKVDEKDLEVLMGYWGQEVNDTTLIAHWKLDGTEGIIAHDHVGTKRDTIMGLPQWRPQGGRIDGALELNGTTFVTAKATLSPAVGRSFLPIPDSPRLRRRVSSIHWSIRMARRRGKVESMRARA